MEKSNNHGVLIHKIYKIISPHFRDIFVEKTNDVGYIQIFDDNKLVKGQQNRFKVAYADMLVFDEEGKPLLVIEPETSPSPKTFGRSIPIYTVARKVKVGNKIYPIESPLLLLIVIPDQPKGGQKDEQLPDLEEKLKKTIHLKNSSILDFSICQIKDFKGRLKRLLVKNGYDRYSRRFD